MQGERQLQVLIGGHNSFDKSVEAVHDNVRRYLPEPWLHSEAIHPHSSLVLGEKLCNVNTAMCYKTYHCLQNICLHPFQSGFGYAVDFYKYKEACQVFEPAGIKSIFLFWCISSIFCDMLNRVDFQ